MAVRITHSVVEGGTVDETAAIDGAAWDAEHVLENPEDLPISTETQLALDAKAETANAFRFVDPTAADGANVFAGVNVGNTTLLPVSFTYEASDNIGLGKDAIYSLTTGFANIAIGLAALGANTTGANNIAIGRVALASQTTGANNTAVGVSAMYRNTTGIHNTAIGLQALYSITTGSNNTAVGRDSGYSNTTGSWNVSVGVDANPGNSTGSGNTVVGGESFYGSDFADALINQNTTGSNNTVVGYHAGSTGGAQNRQGSTAIGYLAQMTADNQVVIGGANVTETLLRGNVKPPSITVTGAAGAGFLDLPTQSAGVGAPAAGVRLYADASDRISVSLTSGFIVKIDPIALTTSRTYTLPNAAGTFAVSASTPLVLDATTGNLTITLGTNVAAFLATPSSANLRAALSDEAGTGVAYFVGGALGTPASATLTNGTGLPISTGVSGLGTNVATFLATPSSANLAAAVTDEDGTGVIPFEATGTWTPIDSSGAGLTFTSVNARYTKIGNMVHAYGTLTVPTTPDATAALIGGLPFTVANATYAAVGSPCKNTAGISGLIVVPVANSTTFRFWNNATAANNTNTALQNGTYAFNISYPVA